MDWMEMCTFCDAGVWSVWPETWIKYCWKNAHTEQNKYLHGFAENALLYLDCCALFCILFHRYRVCELRSDQRVNNGNTEMQRGKHFKVVNFTLNFFLTIEFGSIPFDFIAFLHTVTHTQGYTAHKCVIINVGRQNDTIAIKTIPSESFSLAILIRLWLFFVHICFVICVFVVQWKFKEYDIKIEYSI